MNIYTVTYYGYEDNSIGSSILSAVDEEQALSISQEAIYKMFGLNQIFIVARKMTREELESLYNDIPKVLASMEE